MTSDPRAARPPRAIDERHPFRLAACCILAAMLWGDHASAQIGDSRALERLNKKLAGRVVDHTKNHGADRRIESQVLGCKRDLYVYLPPCYDPARQYSFILWFHGAFGDEQSFIESNDLVHLDQEIQSGACPPIIIACADGTYEGENRLNAQHSFFVNGLGGRYEDYVMIDVLPFVLGHYSIRPERSAHGAGGLSGGGFAALSLAIKHRSFFGSVAVLSAPINMRYWNTKDRYFAQFNPKTYQWREGYDPKQVVGVYFCVIRFRAKRMIERVFGPPEGIIANVAESNPADLMFTTDLKNGELSIYVNYSSHDNFNFDAQSESFAWLAHQKGIELEMEKDNLAWHMVNYFRRNERKAYEWFRSHLPPPTEPKR